MTEAKPYGPASWKCPKCGKEWSTDRPSLKELIQRNKSNSRLCPTCELKEKDDAGARFNPEAIGKLNDWVRVVIAECPLQHLPTLHTHATYWLQAIETRRSRETNWKG